VLDLRGMRQAWTPFRVTGMITSGMITSGTNIQVPRTAALQALSGRLMAAVTAHREQPPRRRCRLRPHSRPRNSDTGARQRLLRGGPSRRPWQPLAKHWTAGVCCSRARAAVTSAVPCAQARAQTLQTAAKAAGSKLWPHHTYASASGSMTSS